MPATQPDKHLWLAEQIFSAFPQDVSGLKFFTLDCGCIYFHRVFRDGLIDPTLSVYRDSKDGPCEMCMCLKEGWEGRLLDECVVYNSGFQMVDG
jgi:hypothetical protein